ncbi:conserved Plasmodium protein, unknown function [Plasmodium chabaudi chabaudi]|uniref:Uncharacterized protein n=1 Tax=Plasmodium chabaudi chabaudi TaxID=31271 RepID=A0A1C6XLQ9_PLACU|nr:conserved Plasmodium protein, unknown function [Plasmodium chabaudi chabaudi]
MNEDILKALTNRELKKTILEKAQKVLSERKNIINEKSTNLLSVVKTNNNIPCCNEDHEEYEVGNKDNISLDDKNNLTLENKNIHFFNLQDFSLRYSKTCKINNLNYESIEYELLVSFMNTFNNKIKFHLKLNNNDMHEDKENCILHKMVKIFSDKLILCCTNPIIMFTQNNDNNSLFDKEIISQVSAFFNQIEEYEDFENLFKNCLTTILEKIFNFKPNADDMATWVSRQAFVDLVKIIIEKSAKRNEQCIIYTADIIKKNYTNLGFFQVDNVVVLIEIIQYAIINLSEHKYNEKCVSFVNEKWFESLQDLMMTLKNCEWKIFLNQLVVIETFLCDKKRQNTKKTFNELHKQQVELSAIKNSSYSKWFKIELPLSMSLFKGV